MLTAEVDRTRLDPGSVALWWLGQSGFAVRSTDAVVYFDPYLSTRLERRTSGLPEPARHVRLCGIPVDPGDVTNADYVFCSHDHGDHLDPETLIPISRASPKSRFIVPRAAVGAVVSLGIAADRVLAADAGRPVRLGGGAVWFVPIGGRHNAFDWSPDHGYPYLGFIVRLSGVTIYHAGDTLLYEGLVESVAPHGIDVALLPINGGDPDRVALGFMSNMTYKEAADLAAAIQAGVVIPAHYGMFSCNDERVESFVDYVRQAHPGQPYHVMSPGEKFVFRRQERARGSNATWTGPVRRT